MKFHIGEENVKCNQCGFMFMTPLPQDKEFTIECPNCATRANYWIEWYINEIEYEDEVPVP